MLNNKNILLIISGGIAAYKSLELIRGLRKERANVRCILTKNGEKFVTPMSLAALSEHKVYTDLWSLKDEREMGHIRLSREADLIVIAPASANLIAKMAHGLADDLASTCLLASDKPIMIAPAMNPMMWNHPATQNNMKILLQRDIIQIEPKSGEMACGETGIGRMSEPDDILSSIKDFFSEKPLKNMKAIVTSGPTYEAIDPVRFLGNRSSGKQGHAIATALIQAGAHVHYITGPTHLPHPKGATIIEIESAEEMLAHVEKNLPADLFIGAAAVCDWTVETDHLQKIKKKDNLTPPQLNLKENPDILKKVSLSSKRPQLVIGFAAETENLNNNAKDKLKHKNCDWIVGNEISPEQNVFGNSENQVCLFQYTEDRKEIIQTDLPRMTKIKIAQKLVNEIIHYFETIQKDNRNECTNPSLNVVPYGSQ